MTEPLIRQRESAAGEIDWPSDVPPILRRLYAARGIRHPAQVDHRLARLMRPDGLTGLERAASLLEQAIAQQQSILVIGDYDCDGATGCAVAVRGLRMLGAQAVDFAVPDSRRHGYGLSPSLLDSLAVMPDLVVTVDNGIAAHAGVAEARRRGRAGHRHRPSPARGHASRGRCHRQPQPSRATALPARPWPVSA